MKFSEFLALITPNALLSLPTQNLFVYCGMEQLLIEALSGTTDPVALLVSPELFMELSESELVTTIGDEVWYDRYQVWMQPELESQRVLVAYG